MLDTNVLISAIVLESTAMQTLVESIAAEHEPLVGAYVLDEFREVAKRKWPGKLAAAESFIRAARFEVVDTPSAGESFDFAIRDPKDAPVLAEAISGKADILITDDKDFGEVAIGKPEILTPAQYAARYLNHSRHRR